MGKGLGSKFAGLFVTSDNDSEVDVEALLQQQINECSEIKTENVVATESIVLNVGNLTTAESIYNENDLQCNEKSIFKVKEIESVLPTTLPIEAKKASVIGMMGVSQLTLETVLADADKRISVLAGALAKFTEETVKTIEESESEIEKFENQINDLKEIITSRKKSQEDQEKIIVEETNKIKAIIEFIK